MHTSNLVNQLAPSATIAAAAKAKELRDKGVNVLEFPDAVWDGFGAASQKVYEEFMGDELFAEIFNDYMPSMRASSGWIADSISAYRSQRDRVFG